MHDMLMESTGMMVGMGLVWLLIVVDLALVGAALAKYVFTRRSS